jgi:hypothetical protein
VITWVCLLASSIANAFTALIDVSDVLYANCHLLTALFAIVYYRLRIFSNAWDAVLIGILSLAATRVPGLDRSQVGPERARSQRCSLIGIVAAGLILRLAARFIPRSQFFRIRREAR